MKLEPLHRLSTASLQALCSSFREGALATGISRRVVHQIAGNDSSDVSDCLLALVESGFRPAQIAIMLGAIADARDRFADADRLFNLIVSGPNLQGLPTGDTSAATLALVADARQRVLIVGYAIHNGLQLFAPLAERMRLMPSLRVRFCINIPRKLGDGSLASEIVYRYVREFREKHWPWTKIPELWYDPRSLDEGILTRSSLHAKCVVVDGEAALITSANMTDAAQRRNIEVGVLTRYVPMVQQLQGYFDALCESGVLVQHSL